LAQKMAQITNRITPRPARIPPTTSSHTIPVQTPRITSKPPIRINAIAMMRRAAHRELPPVEELDDELLDEELELLEDPVPPPLLELEDKELEEGEEEEELELLELEFLELELLELELLELELLELEPGQTRSADREPWQPPAGSVQVTVNWRDVPQVHGGAACWPISGRFGTIVSHDPALTMALPVIWLPSAGLASVKLTLVHRSAAPETMSCAGGLVLLGARTGEMVMVQSEAD
jgi:hypothetical protein